ncbi:MAG: hypothetical protein ACPH3C_06195, partial [Glaciecola sp.]
SSGFKRPSTRSSRLTKSSRLTVSNITTLVVSNVTGLNSNQYGRNVRMLDKNGCLIDVLETPENERIFEVVGS